MLAAQVGANAIVEIPDARKLRLVPSLVNFKSFDVVARLSPATVA